MNHFVADASIARLAEAYSLDVRDLAARDFHKQLDFTDASVTELDAILETYFQSRSAAQPTEEQVAQFGKAFGSYLGEVLRRQHGAEWGLVTFDGQTFPGMRLRDGSLVWPWGRVQQRLLEGPSESVVEYLVSLTKS